MGSCQSRSSQVVTPGNIREVKIVVFGLDNSGKSTLLANLNGDSTEDITPTIGFSSTKLNQSGCAVTLYDVGGGPRIRGIWKNYFSEAYGIIYVVDSSSPDRFTEAADALREVMGHEKIVGKPLLVFANKQDVTEACSEAQLTSSMALEEMVTQEQLQVMKCIALKQASGNKSDPSLRRGLSWLLGSVVSRYEELGERVRCDVTVQREREATERRERMERVRKMREERDKLQAAESEETESVDGPPANPFKPISVVAVEVEQREAARKRIATQAQSTASQNTQDVVREDSVHASPGPSGVRQDSHSSVSQSSSRLSDTASLTDVTPPTAHGGDGSGSSESLQLITPLPHDGPPSQGLPHDGSPSGGLRSEGSRSASPSIAKRTRLEPIKSKKERKQMLITRLKNRNKTFPAPPQPSPLAHRNTWTEAELEPALSTEDPLEGLPPLPVVRRVLPPIHMRGTELKAFHTEEELTIVPSSAVEQVSHPPPVSA